MENNRDDYEEGSDLLNEALDQVEDVIKISYQDYMNFRRLRLWRIRWRQKFGMWPMNVDVAKEIGAEERHNSRLFLCPK